VSKECVIVHFYYLDPSAVPDRLISSLVALLASEESKKRFHIEEVCTFDKAPHFLAHNILE